MKKVFIVIGQLGLGGGERQLYLLLQGMNRQHVDPVVVSFNPGRGDYWEDRLKALKIRILFIDHNRFVFFRILNLWRVLCREKPDVVLSWTLYLNFISALGAKFFCNAVSIGSIRCDLYNSQTPSITLYRFFGTKLSHYYITNSSAGKRDLLKLGIKECRVFAIYNSLSTIDLSNQLDRIQSRQNLGFSLSDVLILNVGRLEPGKNQLMLVRVLRELFVESHGRIKVVFIGKDIGSYKNKVIDEGRKLGVSNAMVFLGEIPNAINYFKGFDLLCHCSEGEGMPNVIAEAGLSSLPIVATKVNGIEDLIGASTLNCIVKKNDHVDMARKASEFLTNSTLREYMIESVRSRLNSKLFSINTIVKQYEQVFLHGR